MLFFLVLLAGCDEFERSCASADQPLSLAFAHPSEGVRGHGGCTATSSYTDDNDAVVNTVEHTYTDLGQARTLDVAYTNGGLATQAFAYDDEHRAVHWAYDQDGDGSDDQAVRWTYEDGSCGASLKEFDVTGADGVYEHSETNVWVDGQLVRVEGSSDDAYVVELGDYVDGAPTWRGFTYAGETEYASEITYDYDDGRLTEAQIDITATEAAVDQVYAWAYDDEGRLVEYTQDFDNDGTDDYTETTTWRDGRLDSVETRYTGASGGIRTYTWDCAE